MKSPGRREGIPSDASNCKRLKVSGSMGVFSANSCGVAAVGPLIYGPDVAACHRQFLFGRLRPRARVIRRARRHERPQFVFGRFTRAFVRVAAFRDTGPVADNVGVSSEGVARAALLAAPFVVLAVTGSASMMSASMGLGGAWRGAASTGSDCGWSRPRHPAPRGPRLRSAPRAVARGFHCGSRLAFRRAHATGRRRACPSTGDVGSQ